MNAQQMHQSTWTLSESRMLMAEVGGFETRYFFEVTSLFLSWEQKKALTQGNC